MLSLTLQVATAGVLAASISLSAIASIQTTKSAIVERLRPVTVELDEQGLHFELDAAESTSVADRPHTNRSLLVFRPISDKPVYWSSPTRVTLPEPRLEDSALERINDLAVVVVNYE